MSLKDDLISLKEDYKADWEIKLEKCLKKTAANGENRFHSINIEWLDCYKVNSFCKKHALDFEDASEDNDPNHFVISW